MNRSGKAFSFSRKLFDLLLCSMVCALAACADAKWPASLTGEPDDSVLAAPRLMGHPTSQGGSEWPNLADVPDSPDDITAPEAWRDLQGEMAQDRAENLMARGRMEATAPVLEESKP